MITLTMQHFSSRTHLISLWHSLHLMPLLEQRAYTFHVLKQNKNIPVGDNPQAVNVSCDLGYAVTRFTYLGNDPDTIGYWILHVRDTPKHWHRIFHNEEIGQCVEATTSEPAN